MIRIRSQIVGVAAIASGVVGCAGTPVDSEPQSPVAAEPSWGRAGEQATVEHALAVYEQYAQISAHAHANPRVQDWRPALSHLMADPALTESVDEITTLSALPAHYVGVVRRSPTAESVSLKEPASVVVTDCLDATDEHLVSDQPDKAGATLERPNQPHRYRLQAEIVRYPAPYRWLIQTLESNRRQAC